MLLLFLNNRSKTKGMKTKWTQVVCSTEIRNPKLIWKLCTCINNKQQALACPKAPIIRTRLCGSLVKSTSYLEKQKRSSLTLKIWRHV